jgi:hypothetical protein
MRRPLVREADLTNTGLGLVLPLETNSTYNSVQYSLITH